MIIVFGSGSDDEPEEVEKTFTRHTAVVQYTNGDEERVVFDSMNISEGLMFLKDYVGWMKTGVGGRFQTQTKMSLSIHNIRKVETEEREKVTETWTAD